MVVTRYTSTVFYLHRVAVVNFVAERSCKMENILDWCYSSILHAAKDCHSKQGYYYNNMGKHLDNLIFPVDLALLVGLVLTCLAIELPWWGNLAWHGRVLSNGRMTTLLVERRVQVLQNRCRCGVYLIEDFGPPPSYQSFLGPCPSLLILRWLILLSVLHPFRMVLPNCDDYFLPLSLSIPSRRL